jgi:hypothetical protein
MSKTFKTFSSRKDASITGFRADDNAALLAAICCNSATGYVREGFECVLVPNHAADAVRKHLVSIGWAVA